MIKRTTLFLLALIFSISLFPQEGIEVEHDNYKIWVTDNEDLFTDQEEAKLNSFLSNYEKQTTVEIAVLTTDTYESEADASDYATWVGEKWGVGKADLDNGLMMVISKTNGNDWAVSTGYGLEGYLPDLYLQTLKDTFNIMLDAELYYDGVTWYLGQCMSELGEEYSSDDNESMIEDSDDSILGWMLDNIPWYVWVIIIVGWLALYAVCPSCALLILYIVTLGRSGSSDKSFGGGGFGGGGSNR